MPVKLGPGKNPLRAPEDRRLNRIAGPSGLIISQKADASGL